MLFRDREGQWQVIVVADGAAGRAHHQLRLQLSARAAAANGFAPIRQGWIVWHGSDGPRSHGVVVAFDTEAIARTMTDVVLMDRSLGEMDYSA